MSNRKGCFFCKHLGKELMKCDLDDNVDINILFIMDEYPENCPLKKGEPMEYKGFKTDNPMQDLEKNEFKATIVNSSKYIAVNADNLENLEDAFHTAVDAFLKECEHYGLEPFQK